MGADHVCISHAHRHIRARFRADLLQYQYDGHCCHDYDFCHYRARHDSHFDDEFFLCPAAATGTPGSYNHHDPNDYHDHTDADRRAPGLGDRGGSSTPGSYHHGDSQCASTILSPT